MTCRPLAFAMCVRREFERIRAVLAQANLDASLAAREPLRLLEKDGDVFDSAHRVPSMSV